MEKLKYLFEVEYHDGTLFIQPEDDRSKTDPLKSAYYDLDQSRIKKFFLVEVRPETANQKVFSVDLTDGHFEVNGIPLFLHDDRTTKDFRLIFFRRHKHGFNLEGAQQFHHTTYRLGWQYTENGKNYQQVIEFN